MRVSNLREDLANFVWDEIFDVSDGLEMGDCVDSDELRIVLDEMRRDYFDRLFMGKIGDRDFERKMDLSKELYDLLIDSRIDYVEFT